MEIHWHGPESLDISILRDRTLKSHCNPRLLLSLVTSADPLVHAYSPSLGTFASSCFLDDDPPHSNRLYIDYQLLRRTLSAKVVLHFRETGAQTNFCRNCCGLCMHIAVPPGLLTRDGCFMSASSNRDGNSPPITYAPSYGNRSRQTHYLAMKSKSEIC